MVLHNYTPHPVTVLLDDIGLKTMVIPNVGLARCETEEVEVAPLNLRNGLKIPTKMKNFGKVKGLPDPEIDVGYIVSMAVANACPDRHDLYVPGDVLRNTDGSLIGCRSLWYVG